MNLSLRHCRYLLALDTHRHYGHAAEALSISQPALSRAIQSLEREIGTRLFDRSRRGVIPTEAGRLFIDFSQRLLATAAELESEILQARKPEGQKLTVASGHYPAELIVPGALSALLREWPEAQVEMEVTDWPRAVEMLMQGACQLAICELTDVDASLEAGVELLNDRRLFPMVRKGHPLARLAQPTLADLLSYPWACSQIPRRAAGKFGDGPWAAGTMHKATGNFNPRIIAPSLTTSIKLVTESDFVGMTPLSPAYPYMQQGSLELVNFAAPWMRLNYGFLRDVHKPLTPVMKAFMTKVREMEAQTEQRERALLKRLAIEVA
ncbi:MAG: LysR family transcriptional regulator [Lysobacterales bacterium]|jgi:DNA-binding transcriptional LysR family regulator